MVQFETKYFGPVESDPADLLHFPAGLPAFEQETKFILLDIAERRPLIFLQSAIRQELCFVVCPMGIVDPDYRLWTSPEDLATLELPVASAQSPRGEVMVWAILSIPPAGEGEPVTANLLAPLVVNPKNRLGVQAIRCDSEYSHQHRVQVSGC